VRNKRRAITTSSKSGFEAHLALPEANLPFHGEREKPGIGFAMRNILRLEGV
jgi:hypothetical protein